jgi:hypothetical protein
MINFTMNMKTSIEDVELHVFPLDIISEILQRVKRKEIFFFFVF